jgi:RND family efflux transporter MFP subunit
MRKWAILGFLILVTVVLFARFFWASWRGEEVALSPVTKGKVVEAIYATGKIDTDLRATVRARRPGPLKSLLVGLGEPVNVGQVVAEQEDTEGRLALQRARKELEALQASAAQAQDEAQRAEKLFQVGLLPERDWIFQRDRALELAQRAAAQAAAVNLAEAQLSWYALRAPLTGTVSQLHRRRGDLLAEGDEILTIVNLDAAYLRVAVDERDLGKIRPGQEVRMLFDAFPQQPLLGEVWRVVPAVDRLTRSADVLVKLPQNHPPLQLDLSATVNIVANVYAEALLVPRGALRGVGTQRTVLKLGPQRRLQEALVTVGACDAERCQVLSGLQEGDLVAQEAGRLRPGIKVRQL